MKGLEIQFQGISNFLESGLRRPIDELTWEVYLFNIQKMTFQTLGLISIIFDDPDRHLPPVLSDAYRHVSQQLKEYFQRKPKGNIGGESDSDDDEGGKQVDEFLKQRSQLPGFGEGRGDLFKFLQESEATAHNNKVLLDSIPRFSYGGPGVNPLGRGQSNGKSVGRTASLMAAIQEPIKPVQQKRARPPTRAAGVGTESQTELNQKGISEIYLLMSRLKNVAGSQMRELMVELGLQCDKEQNEVSLFCEQGVQTMSSGSNAGQSRAKNQKGVISKKKDSKVDEKRSSGVGKDVTKSKKTSQRTSKTDLPSANDMKKTSTSAFHQPKHKESQKNNLQPAELKAERARTDSSGSVRSVTPNEQMKTIDRPLLKTKKTLSQASVMQNVHIKEEIKEEQEHQEESQKEILSPEGCTKKGKKVKTEADQTQQDSQAKRQQEGEKATLSKKKAVRRSLIKQDTYHSSTSDPSRGQRQQSLEKQLLSPTLRPEKMRESVDDNKQNNGQLGSSPNHSQAYNTAAGFMNRQKFPSNRSDKSQSMLPKIQEMKKAKAGGKDYTNGWKGFEKSPYAQRLEKSLDGKKKLNPMNKSLHMNSSLSHLTSQLSSNLGSVTGTLHQQGSWDHKHWNLLGLQGPEQWNKLSKSEQEELLQRHNKQLVTDIDATIEKKTFHLPGIVRMVRQFENLHLRACGDNCIHLTRFNEFLKRRNLQNCLRRELLPHKKNIEMSMALNV